jgi:hypothetical protein
MEGQNESCNRSYSTRHRARKLLSGFTPLKRPATGTSANAAIISAFFCFQEIPASGTLSTCDHAGIHPMHTLFTRLLLPTTFILLLPYANPAMAQRPTWTPLAELLVGSLGEADPARMSDVMSRCTALNMLFAGLSAEFSTEMSENYEHEAHQLIEHGVLIESNMEEERTGQKADLTILSGVMVERVKGMLEGYNAWLDDNQATSGFSINKDIELEMDSCKLASRLMAQLAVE